MFAMEAMVGAAHVPIRESAITSFHVVFDSRMSTLI